MSVIPDLDRPDVQLAGFDAFEAAARGLLAECCWIRRDRFRGHAVVRATIYDRDGGVVGSELVIGRFTLPAPPLEVSEALLTRRIEAIGLPIRPPQPGVTP